MFFNKLIRTYLQDQRFVFWCIFYLALIIMPLASFDFGITYDENVHNIHGRISLDYFEGKNKRAQISPLDDNGNAISVSFDGDSEEIRGLNGQADLFDLICNFIYSYLSPFGEFENRHFINALFGVLAILFTGLLTKELAGWRAGWFALLFCIISPRFFGHSMNNPKDLPFATMYIFCIYQSIIFVKGLPGFKWKNMIALAVGIALACDIRISGMLIIPYLFLFTFIYWAVILVSRGIYENELKPMALSFAAVAGISLTGYLAMSILWPYAQLDPLHIPYQTLTRLSNYTQFNSMGLFEGRHLNNWEIPWYFIPKWIGITAPLFIIIGFLAIPLLYLGESVRNFQLNRMHYSLVIFTFIFPIVYVIYKKSNVYDDGRHLLFVYPSLVVMAAISWENLLLLTKEYYAKIFLMVVFVGTLLEPFRYMVMNHKLEAFYFNPLVGGTKGAFKKYELDYWGSSMKQAVEWVQEHKKPVDINRPIRIVKWYGSFMSTAYYIKKVPGYYSVESNGDWDYAILLPGVAKFYPGMLDRWPEPGTIYQVTADGAPVCAVVANPATQNDGHIIHLDSK